MIAIETSVYKRENEITLPLYYGYDSKNKSWKWGMSLFFSPRIKNKIYTGGIKFHTL